MIENIPARDRVPAYIDWAELIMCLRRSGMYIRQIASAVDVHPGSISYYSSSPDTEPGYLTGARLINLAIEKLPEDKLIQCGVMTPKAESPVRRIG